MTVALGLLPACGIEEAAWLYGPPVAALFCRYDGDQRFRGNVHQTKLILRCARQLTQSDDSRIVTIYGGSPDRVFVDDFENVVVSIHASV